MENTEKAGGTRFNAGKPSGWWYAPLLGLRLVAPVWEQGAKKYAPKDWRVGQSFSVLIDCAMRHMLEVVDKGPISRCPESGNLHAAHAVWNLLCLLTLIVSERYDCDDVTKWEGVTTDMKQKMEAFDASIIDDVTVSDVREAANVLARDPTAKATLATWSPVPGTEPAPLTEGVLKEATEKIEEVGKQLLDRSRLGNPVPFRTPWAKLPEPTPREMAREHTRSVEPRCRICGQRKSACSMYKADK